MDYRRNLILLMKKNLLLIMRCPTVNVTGGTFFIYFSTKQSSTHPHFFVQNQLHECLKCDKCSQPHQHSSQPSKNTGRHPLMRVPAYCMMMPCVGVFLPWLTSDYCDVCWESCIWFHWLVLQGFTGLTGLFPSKCEGIVSLCCTWASCWLCTQTGKLLKMGIAGFVFTQNLTLHGGWKSCCCNHICSL